MHNIAEEITGEWLRHIKKCEFVEYNVKGPHQTEIDVIGLNIINKEIYVCEVAAHIHGLQYVDPQKRRPDTENRFIHKFTKDQEYIQQHFDNFTKHYMLWSPIVKSSKEGAKYDALKSVLSAKEVLKKSGINLELVINERYYAAIQDLRKEALKQTHDLSNSSVLRYLQIEEYLNKYLSIKK